MKSRFCTIVPILLLCFGISVHAAESKAKHVDTVKVRIRVSNQSFTISPVDIKIQADKTVVVEEKFEVGNQHLSKSFWVELSQGAHKISITSKKGKAELVRDISVSAKNRFIDIDYWYYPKTKTSAGTPHKFTMWIGTEDRKVE